MSEQVVALALLIVLGVGVMTYWYASQWLHERRLTSLAVRVHVNGIRGKSTVTRLVAAVLREGGYITVAKTTGSAARVIGQRGQEDAIFRRGAATINEQVDVVREHITADVEALVIECMAVRPLYQQYAQDHIVKSDITIITNVREDHQEEMGETLEEISDSMSLTIPRRGTLITAEERPALRARMAAIAERRGSQMIYADPRSVSEADKAGFDHMQFRENVAVGIDVARLLGIDREVALRGMWKAVPDIGVVRLHRFRIGTKSVLWVPLFAANDRESVLMTFEELAPQMNAASAVIGILNNRADRGRRAELFAGIVATDLRDRLDHVITFGTYEDLVSTMMANGGYPAEQVSQLGESRNPSLEQILARIEAIIPGPDAVLVGMVNIHTHQAEMLLEHFDRKLGMPPDGITLSRSVDRLPRGSSRLRWARAHVDRKALVRDDA